MKKNLILVLFALVCHILLSSSGVESFAKTYHGMKTVLDTLGDRKAGSKTNRENSAAAILADPSHIIDSTEYSGLTKPSNLYGWPGGQVGIVENVTKQRINGYNTLRFMLSRRQSVSTERTELSVYPTAKNPYTYANDPSAVRWVGDAIYVPSDYVFDASASSQVLLYQFLPLDSNKAQRPSCNNLRIVNNKWVYRIEYDTVNTNDYLTSSTYKRIDWDLGPVEVGTFTRWVTHVKFSWTSSGYLKVYKNGQLVIDYSGPTAHNDPNGYIPWFKFGVYKPLWGLIDNEVQTPTNTITIYHSDTRLGKSNATYSDMATLTQLANPSEYMYMNVAGDSVKVLNKLILPGTSSQYVRGDGSLGPAGFEYAANKSNVVNLGTSSVHFPTQLAVKTYVDTRAILKKGTIPETAILDTIRLSGIYYASDGSNNTPELGYPVTATGLLLAMSSSLDASGAQYQEYVTSGASKYYRFKSPTSPWTAWNLFGKDTSLVHTSKDETIRGNKTFTGITSLGVTNISGVSSFTGLTNTLTGATTLGNSTATPLTLFRTGVNQLSMRFQNESLSTYLGITTTGELRVGSSNNLVSNGQIVWHSGNMISSKVSLSGNGTQTEFVITHAAASIPKNIVVTAASRHAAGAFFVDSIDASTFKITFLVAPPAGTNNVKLNWILTR